MIVKFPDIHGLYHYGGKALNTTRDGDGELALLLRHADSLLT